MKTTCVTAPMNTPKSIYSILLRSEEPSRNAVEALIYAMLIVCALFAMWKVAQQPIIVPEAFAANSTSSLAVRQNG